MNPYNTPTAPAQPSAVDCASKQKTWKRARWVALIVFLIPAALSVLKIVAISRELFVIAYSSGIGDPSTLSAIIGEAIILIVASLALSLPGLILLIFSQVRLRFWRKMG